MNPIAIYCIPTSPDHWCARCARNIKGKPSPQGTYRLLDLTDSTSVSCIFKPVEQSKGELRGPL
jgi:hypothetical protein